MINYCTGYLKKIFNIWNKKMREKKRKKRYIKDKKREKILKKKVKKKRFIN